MTQLEVQAVSLPVAHGDPPDPPLLADAVRSALNKTGYGWLQRVVVTTTGGAVVLRGTVPSFHLKQLAQVTVMAVPGVEVLRNELDVAADNDHGDTRRDRQRSKAED
jgi:osmotically-inducible protein OsmY